MSWSYQTCTEQGTFQTLNRSNSRHPFAMDATVEESVEQCVMEFGGMYVHLANLQYLSIMD